MHDHSKHSHRIFLGVCLRVEKKRTAIRGRVSTLFLELTCCDINEDFRLIRSMQLKELRPVFFQHQKGRRARSEHLDGYPEPLQHVHRRSCSSRTGWSCANFERTPDRAITKIRQQRTHRELRSTRTPAHGWLVGCKPIYFPVDSTLLLNIRHDTCSSSASFSIRLNFISCRPKKAKRTREKQQAVASSSKRPPKLSAAATCRSSFSTAEGRRVGVDRNAHDTRIYAYFCSRSAHAFTRTRFLFSVLFLLGPGRLKKSAATDQKGRESRSASFTLRIHHVDTMP